MFGIIFGLKTKFKTSIDINRLICGKIPIEDKTKDLYEIILEKNWKMFIHIFDELINRDEDKLNILNNLLSKYSLLDKGISCSIIIRKLKNIDDEVIKKIKKIIENFPYGNSMDLYLLDKDLKSLGIYDGYLNNKSFINLSEAGLLGEKLTDIIEYHNNKSTNILENNDGVDISINQFKGIVNFYVLNKDHRETILKTLKDEWVPDTNIIGVLYLLSTKLNDIEMLNILKEKHLEKINTFLLNPNNI